MSSSAISRLLAAAVIAAILPGCAGSKTAVKSETRQRAEKALERGVRADQKGDSAGSAAFLAQSLDISTSIEDYPARTAALINLARLYRLQRDLPRAAAYAEQALAAAEHAPDLFAEAAYEKALTELATGNTSEALDWALRSIAADRGSDQIGRRLNLAARIRSAQGAWGEAGRFAGDALEANRSAGLAEEEANSLRMLGVVARHEGRIDAAMKLLEGALQIDKRVGESGKIATDLEELAATARQAGRLKEAAGFLERAVEVNRAGGHLQQVRDNRAALADIYTALGDPLKAERARKSDPQQEIQGAGRPSTTTSPSSRP